ncbi:RpiB/LacA/LacB family sugar-phosphate isomerase [Candidatus Parcubacteria bacterium]|jgi:ribose 5-phosphate isomerase B|nr:RpiB/LacA/LacB family sugar-phosphate isomerase [Candidatus Parcubacteria bacterium]
MYSGPLYIASDHGGYQLKKRLIRYCENELKLEIEDMGPLEHDPDDDYPDFVIPLAKKVVETKGRGIVICRNGVGVSIAVNKVKGVKCGIGYNTGAAESMIKDDNTNIISLAADHLSDDLAILVLKKWLDTEYTETERHARRLGKVEALEQ